MPLLFQYGSNCDTTRLNSPERLAGAAEDLGRGETIEEYDLAFDVWSGGNKCAASDLVPAPGTGRHALGVLFEVPADWIRGKKRPDGKKTMEEIEGSRYAPTPIRVRNQSGEEVEATTFLVKPDQRRDGFSTSAEYVGYIVNGLRAHDVPEEYVQHVIDIAIQTNQRAIATAVAIAQSRQIETLRPPR